MTLQPAQSSARFSFITHKLDAAAKQFTFLHCDSRSLLQESLKVRHQVYCSELRWEQQQLSGYELDQFDVNATHFLAWDKTTQRAVATFRIISGQDLPVAKFNEEKIFSSGRQVIQQSNACEISRLSILKSYRNCVLSDGLMLFAAYTAFNMGFEIFYSMMEHRLARKLKKLHIHVSQLTDSFEHRGTRAIYQVLESDLAPLMSELKVLASSSDAHKQRHDCHGRILACA